jgi:predicted transcriptional regulator
MTRLRRLWRAMCYDPLVEYQRAKALLERRLIQDILDRDRRRSLLKLVRSPREGDE